MSFRSRVAPPAVFTSLAELVQEGSTPEEIYDRTAHIQPDLTQGSRWPVFAARVVAATPVRGAMSVGLPVDRAKVGALNLFSDMPNAFDSTSVGHAYVLVRSDASHQGSGAKRRRGIATARACEQSRDQ